ncbi:hypothetical protein NHQ30_011696 [Ciborinia camelliae]|nr:hypothetical protein NHQ30_011696 [Ciborinia camelliae]
MDLSYEQEAKAGGSLRDQSTEEGGSLRNQSTKAGGSLRNQSAEAGGSPRDQSVKVGGSLRHLSNTPIVSMAHPRVQTRVQEWLSQIDVQQLRKIEDPRVPVEVLFQVIEELVHNNDYCTSTALALTGRAYWSFFKKLHPDAILLTTQIPASTYSCDDLQPCTLAMVLQPWFGSQYRYSERLSQYLSRSIYGDLKGEKERALVRRTKDFHGILSWQGDTAGEKILPNPFGMGEDWYIAAVRQFVTHVEKERPDISTVGGTLLHQLPGTKEDFSLRESVRMSNLAMKNQYARSTMMQKSYLWAWMGLYVHPRIPNWGTSDGTYTRRRCFWEEIVQASRQDWERHFLLIEDGVKVPKIGLAN